MPGVALAANPPVFSPQVTRNISATVYVSFSTSKNSDIPYSVTEYSTLYISYKRKSDGKEISEIKALDGYVGNSTSVGSNVTFAGVEVDTYAVTVSASNPTSRPTGLTILETDCEKYLTDTSGVTIWRNTSVKYSF
jgi:hypothetical protein